MFTTNYDTVLEQQLQALGEPYHLYYMLDEGLFAHSTPRRLLAGDRAPRRDP